MNDEHEATTTTAAPVKQSEVLPAPRIAHPFGPCGYKYCDWPDGELRCNESRAAAPLAAPVVDNRARKLTLPELNHLSALLEAERESGQYAGPRGRYYARTERLIKWCNEQIGET